MNTSTRLFLFSSMLLVLSFTACEKESPIPVDAAVELRTNGQSSAHCINISHQAASVPLGFVCLPAPLNVCGFGATPGPATIGGITGNLSSVVTEQEVSGQGATHFRLIHYFDDGQGNTFWTEDRAICAPSGNDPTQCRVNDVLAIVGGTGVFANPDGQLRNKGIIDFANFTLSVDLRGRICGDGL